MGYPALLHCNSDSEWRSYFASNYCRRAIRTSDGIAVRFSRRDFDHCFFESVRARKDKFSVKRAERMLWIKAALQDHDAELHVGWDSKKKCFAADRRVAIVQGDYVVVIRMTGEQMAGFVTAFVADGEALRKIRTNPKWPEKNR